MGFHSSLENMGLNPEFWQNRRVFLTGHSGFKGAWMSLWLQSLGAEVTGYSLAPPTDPSLHADAGVAKGMTSLEGDDHDVRDLEALCSALSTSRAEVVIHMAAQALVRPSYDDPVGTFSTNVMGTVNLLEAVRRVSSVRSVVVVTTDKCYENREWEWGYRENDPMGGHDAYSASKGCAELAVAAYRKSFYSDGKGPSLATARAGNVIGGGDWAADRLVPDCVRAWSAGDNVTLRYPNATRPWQHVLDPLHGYLMLCERLFAEGGSDFAKGWNFGPSGDGSRRVGEVVQLMSEVWGPGADLRIESEGHPHESRALQLDCSRARDRLDWVPVWQLENSVVKTTEWYRAYLNCSADSAAVRALCENQISDFMKALKPVKLAK